MGKGEVVGKFDVLYRMGMTALAKYPLGPAEVDVKKRPANSAKNGKMRGKSTYAETSSGRRENSRI